MNQLFYPPKHLKDYVRYYWIMDSSKPLLEKSVLHVAADIYPRMVFQHINGKSSFSVSSELLPTSYLSGIKTDPLQIEITSNKILIVSLFPSALKVLFKIDCNELVNTHPDLENFAPKDLTDLIIETEDYEKKLMIITDFLTSKLPRFDCKSNSLIYSAINWYYNSDMPLKVGEFLSKNNVSERKLERQFKDGVGIPFKHFLKIQRFEQSLRLIKETEYSLAEVAFLSNYFDQSHFTKEFKLFSGFTPNYFRNRKTAGNESNAVLLND